MTAMTVKPLRAGRLSLGSGIPKVCIPAVGKNADAFLFNLRAAVKAGPDLIELRIDTLASDNPESVIRRAVAEASGIPLLLTCRSKRDGGEGSPETYPDILCHLLRHNPGFSLIDLEISAGETVFAMLRQKAAEQGIPVIGSWHSFSETPDEDTLVRRFSCIEACGADAAKVAVMPHSSEDVDRLITAARRAGDLLQIPLIAISMGSLGVKTRMECESFGSCMTFASAGTESAPGQLPAEMVRAALRKQHELLNQKG